MTTYVMIRPERSALSIDVFMLSINSARFPLLHGGWLLLKEKRRYIGMLVFREVLVLLSTWALINAYTPAIIFLPLIISFIEKKFELWVWVSLFWEVKAIFREMANRHFASLPYNNQKRVDDMEALQNKIESAGSVMTQMIIWGIPTIVRASVAVISTLIASIWYGLWWVVPMGVITMGLFYYIHLAKKRSYLSHVREECKNAQEQEDIIRKFRLQQFQNRQRDEQDIESMIRPREELELQFGLGWDTIAYDVIIFFTIMSIIWLIPVMTDFTHFLIAKSVYDQLRNAIEMMSHFGNQMAASVKNFDKYNEFYNKCSCPEEGVTQKTFPTAGLCFTSVKISFPGGFSLSTDTNLNVIPGECVMLRGPSNSGKTQLLNALQGLIDGANLEHGNPKEYTSLWEYMNQQVRDGIPTNGITLRKLLDGEADDQMLKKITEIAMIEHHFATSTDYDRPLDGLSGGEKMRICIAFSLWQAQRYNRKVVVMDEPDQGLDGELRIEMLKRICIDAKNNGLTVLVVYHGDDANIPEMTGFDRAWIFTPHERYTSVRECAWKEYQEEMWKSAFDKLVKCQPIVE